MKLARWIFGIAGVYGILVIAPLYFAEAQIAQNDPPAITHPEFFYGFIGVTLAWQLVFLVIARNPVRYRPLMLVSVLEKLAYGIPAIALFMQQRIKTMTLAFGCIDLRARRAVRARVLLHTSQGGVGLLLELVTAVAPASTGTIPPALASPARSAAQILRLRALRQELLVRPARTCRSRGGTGSASGSMHPRNRR